MGRFWNAWEPGQRTWVGRRERCEAPVEDGGHVPGSVEVASGGGCQQVAERVLSGLGRQREQDFDAGLDPVRSLVDDGFPVVVV